MRQLIDTHAHFGSTLAVLLPLGLWAMLWLGISPRNPAAILNPESSMAFAHGLRAVLPFAAAGAAMVIVGIKVFQRSPRGFGFFGPLGLAALYGLVGLVAALNSPDGSMALWGAALYLAVPVVLWSVVWSANPLDQLHRLVNATWLVVILASAALFVAATLYLDLVDSLLNPAQLLQCKSPEWLELSAGRLRSTGVGRYAAIAGLIALSGLWQGRWRPIWLLVLLTSLTLLLFTAARGSFGGFAAGASLIFITYLIYAGKRALLSALLAMLVLVPLVWSTGIHRDFLEGCVFRGPAPWASVFAEAPSDAATELPTNSLNVSAQVATQASSRDVAIKEKSAATSLVPTQALEVAGSAGPPQEAPQAAEPGSVATQALEVAGSGGSPQVATQAAETGSVATQALEVAGPAGPPQEATQTAETGLVTTQALGVAGSAGPPQEATQAAEPGLFDSEFFEFTGRMAVWKEGWKLIKSSPLIGFGFHADRLLLGTHMHNSVLHALLQTGLIGAIPFVAAVIFAWVLFFRIVRKLNQVYGPHKHLVIQCGGVLAFLTMRSFPESTGAFFGVDWLILAPVLFYLQVVNYGHQPLEVNGDRRILERA